MPSQYTFTDYSPDWPAAFDREAERLTLLLGDALLTVHHSGSTSVPGLAAKPIIDLLQRHIAAVVATPEYRTLIENGGQVPVSSTPAELRQVLTQTLDAYKLPTIADVPEIVTELLDIPDAHLTNLGSKGLGEPPIVPTAAAIANAIADACGVRLFELPLTAEKIYRAINGKTE